MPRPPPPTKSLYGGKHSFAGSAGSQPELPLESAQQVPSGLSRQDQPLGHSESAAQATRAASHALVAVGSQLQSSGTRSGGVLDAEGVGAGIAGSAEPDEPEPELGGELGVPPPLDPEQLHCCCSLQVKPAPQSASAAHESVQRGWHSLLVVVSHVASAGFSGQAPSTQSGGTAPVSLPTQFVCCTSAQAMPSAQSLSTLQEPGRHTETVPGTQGLHDASMQSMAGQPVGSISQVKPLGQLVSPHACSANAACAVNSGANSTNTEQTPRIE
jgi:hypothetical protein